MCGIFGATERERFLTLYNLNRERGTFATTLCFVTQKGDMIVHRWSGPVDAKTIDKKFDEEGEKVLFYVGHTQAPTSAKRKYSKDTSHPFTSGNFTVAHNGVLTNFTDLISNYKPTWSNPVDSSIIPYMFALHEEERNTENNIAAITTSLGQLEGTFGLWIYDSNRRTMFLARCGSTLFANVLTNEFSSIKFKNSEPLEEGHLYQLTPEGVTSVALFDFNSPFFT